MANTKYTYSIQNDFPNHAVGSDRLTVEIQSSSIATSLLRIDTYGDNCDIWFEDALSGADKTTLDGLVAAHSGQPLPDPGQCSYHDVDPTVNDDTTQGFSIGYCWFNTTNDAAWTCLDNIEGAALWKLATTITYQESDDSTSTSTNTSEQTKLSLTKNLPAGEYIALWSCETKSTEGIEVWFNVDGNEAGYAGMDKESKFEPLQGTEALTLTENSHTLDLKYASETVGKSAMIRRAHLVIWRIG